MSSRIYEPEKNNKWLMWVFFVFIIFVGWNVFTYTQQFLKESECEELARKEVSDLGLEYDRKDIFDKVKNDCLKEDVESENKKDEMDSENTIED